MEKSDKESNILWMVREIRVYFLIGLADKSEERKICALLNSLSKMVWGYINKLAATTLHPLSYTQKPSFTLIRNIHVIRFYDHYTLQAISLQYTCTVDCFTTALYFHWTL